MAITRQTAILTKSLALGCVLAVAVPLSAQELIVKSLDQAVIEGRIAGQEVKYRLENKGTKVITAWAIELGRWFGKKKTGATQRIDEGWQQLSHLDEADRSPGTRHHGVMFPERIMEGTFSIGRGRGGALPDRLELWVTALIYDDLSFSGSTKIIDRLRANRRAEWMEYARWGKILRSARSLDELRDWGPRIAAAPPADETLPSPQLQVQENVRTTLAEQIEQFTRTNNDKAVAILLELLQKKEKVAARHAGVSDLP